jgi:PAS domain S-box-containing protein
MKFIYSLRFKMFLGLALIIALVTFSLYLNINKALSISDVAKATSTDSETLMASIDSLIRTNLVYIGVIVVFGFVIVVYIANSITQPINAINAQINMLGKGEIPEIDLTNISKDEIGQMQTALQSLSEGLKQTAQFAVKIGNGELDAKFNPLSDRDMLGHALLNMRTNLREADLKDEDRNKIVLCNSEVGNILRSHNQLDAMGDDLLKYLCKKVNATQGAFYLIEENNEGGKFIHLSNTFAYDKKKKLQRDFKFGEGLVGQAAIEMDYVHRTEIPRDYVSITSGLLGEKRPSSLFIMPLITNDNIYGLLEFASVHKLQPLEIDIIKNVSEIVAQTIFNLQVNERTTRLLSESQRMSSELQQNSQVLQQNALEMQATQEELQKSNIKLGEQIEEVNKSQKRTHVLLENSSEVIQICDKSANILYVSPSVYSILGYSPEELVGTSDLSRISTHGVPDYQRMFDNLISDPDSTITIQYSYKQKNGEEIWLEVAGKNLLKDSAINGIVLNIRDITERRNAEKEARMRSQMQSLSENSPDLIARFNKEGNFYYVNPTIELLTDKKPDQFLKKNIFDAGIDPSVANSWQDIITSVLTNKQKIQVEMPFPTPSGNLVMNVNAIPEYSESNSIESILLVSNDITERKKAEVEIQLKNKKITESINYAQRIQIAIIPERERIRSLIPEFFMLYIPRDVVSGDFPWFVETETDIFIAAVDCTGHGVPGAMLSLIGYFLLNDIVKSQKVSEPGKILDLLDFGVTKTLKQDFEGNEMKDGMDISLCKISKDKKTLEYSGAHRPLYHLRDGEIIEYKGNKFPIGGGLFKNQTNFTNYTIDIKKTDSFFFSSDGYPDQFGGPDNKKIGPARIRAIIDENKKVKDFNKMENVFGEFFSEWKGTYKQLDDILLMGLRF